MDQADREVERLKSRGKRVWCVWDGSVIEKPESEKLEGLSPVVSSKAKRLRKSRKGVVYTVQGGKPITVAGMHWIGALITGMDGLAFVALMDWWTTKGKYATKQRNQEALLLTKLIGKWGQKFTCDLWWAAIRHASYASQVYDVKVRVGKSVWRLITNEPVLTEEQAWSVFFT